MTRLAPSPQTAVGMVGINASDVQSAHLIKHDPDALHQVFDKLHKKRQRKTCINRKM